MIDQPKDIPGARVCILRYHDETRISSNIAGFKLLGQWIAWLVDSQPEENFHIHLLWHLESEASRFDGVKPKNVWFLDEPEEAIIRDNEYVPEDATIVKYEVTFMVLTDAQLDELAAAQETGIIPKQYWKSESSWEAECGEKS